MRNDTIATRGFLRSVGVIPEILVYFQYNPTQLTDKRTVTYATINAPGQLMPLRQYNQGGDRTITFTVTVDGLFPGPVDDVIGIARDDNGSIQPELNTYRAFLYPQTSRWRAAGASFAPLYRSTPTIDDQPQFASPPACQFGFGTRGEPQVIDCLVTEVSIQETLFDDNLAPLRAQVSVTLVEYLPYGAARSSTGGR